MNQFRLMPSLCCGIVLLLFAPLLQAQTTTTAPETQPVTLVGPELTVEKIQDRITQLEQNSDLDEATRNKAIDLYKQAIAQQQKADEFQQRIAALEKAIAAAPQELQNLQEKLKEAPVDPEYPDVEDKSLDQLNQELTQAEGALADAKRRLAEIEAEPARRKDRRAEIANLIVAAKKAQDELAARQVSESPAEQAPAVTLARKILQQARSEALVRELASYEKELATFDATARTLPLRQQLAARAVARAEKLLAFWQKRVNEKRDQEIAGQGEEAEQAQAALEDSHPILQQLAKDRNAYVELRGVLSDRLKIQQVRQTAESKLLGEIREDARELREKVEKADSVTRAMGLQLRDHQARLPNVKTLRQQLRTLEQQTSEAQIAQLDLQRKQSRLVEENILQEIAQQLEQPPTEAQMEEYREILDRELPPLREVLSDLISDYEQYATALIDRQTTLEQLINQTVQLSDYIAERILWLRSHEAFDSQDLATAFDAWRWIVSPQRWWSLLQLIRNDVFAHPVLIATALLPVLVLLGSRRVFRRRLERDAEIALQSRSTSIVPTLMAFAWTALMVVGWPMLLWVVAWRVSAPLRATEFDKAVAAGLRQAAVALLIIEALRQTCRSKGLAEAHLNWSPRALRLVRRNLLWLTAVGLPLTFFAAAVRWQETNPEWYGSLGRLTFLAGIIILLVFTGRMMHPRFGVVANVLAQRRGRPVERFRWVWYPTLLLLLVGLAGLSLSGYHYTAHALLLRLQRTVWFILGLMIVKGIVLRWLFLVRRKLAITQARKRLAERQAEATKSQDEPATETLQIPPAKAEEINIAQVSSQTDQLIGVVSALALLIGLWQIWEEMLPALLIFRQQTIWSGTTITIADAALGCIAIILTVVASKNLTGFLEIAVLPHLQIESGERYAIVTVVKYAIAGIGAVVTFSLLNIGWQKVQWLAAGLTVGLGFGLQEIFANFVSGLILLFERPIRVGDTVTVGQVSGTVTQIRIRATTITGWDRKELIIPNKQFVTGEVVNWTLSDSVLRIIIPVGIAYGSDTAKAQDVMMQAAKAHPQVLSDPAPRVLFLGFGDSSLNYELRVYIADINWFLQTTHDLHFAVDQAFRKSGIEISFPQRDLHIRSVKATFPTTQLPPPTGGQIDNT